VEEEQDKKKYSQFTLGKRWSW